MYFPVGSPKNIYKLKKKQAMHEVLKLIIHLKKIFKYKPETSCPQTCEYRHVRTSSLAASSQVVYRVCHHKSGNPKTNHPEVHHIYYVFTSWYAYINAICSIQKNNCIYTYTYSIKVIILNIFLFAGFSSLKVIILRNSFGGTSWVTRFFLRPPHPYWNVCSCNLHRFSEMLPALDCWIVWLRILPWYMYRMYVYT